jgi:cytidylate kinase
VKGWLKSEHQVYQADIEMRRAAQDLIVTRDFASEDYIKRYYNCNWADPTLYHLVLNTGKMSLEQAAQIIVEVVKILQLQALPA